MKILITNDGPFAHQFIRIGLARAFQNCGHTVQICELGQKPLFDVFDEFEPELLLTQTYNVNRAMVKCIEERPHLKVIMKASDWGPMQEKIDLKEYPVLVAKQEEIDTIAALYEKTGTPNFVHCHYHPNRIESTHGFWRDKLGIKIVGLMSAADVFDYSGGTFKEGFRSDIAFIGGYWGYKSKTLNRYLLRLCNVDRPYRIKIFGNQPWPVPQYCGAVGTEHVKDVLASATICPNISEPHSQVFGYDIVERPWKILANGGFCISDYVESMEQDVFTQDEVVFVKTPEEFEQQVLHYLRYPDERVPYMERGYQTVITKHTYFQRIEQIFKELNMPYEAENVVKVYESMKGNK